MKESTRIQVTANKDSTLAGTIYNAIFKDNRPSPDPWDILVGPTMERDGDTYIHVGDKEDGTEIWRECIYNEMGGGHLGEKKLVIKHLIHKDPKSQPYSDNIPTRQ